MFFDGVSLRSFYIATPEGLRDKRWIMVRFLTRISTSLILGLLRFADSKVQKEPKDMAKPNCAERDQRTDFDAIAEGAYLRRKSRKYLIEQEPSDSSPACSLEYAHEGT